MTIRRIALVSKDSAISASELMDVAAALQKQVVDDFGPIWNIQATVNAFHKVQEVPLGYWPIVIQDKIGMDGAGGFHDKKKQPFARVLYDPSTPVWTVAASHELLEMLADPSGNQLFVGPSLHPGQGPVEYVMEVCDPCETMACAYTVNGVMVSDFYTPDFKNPSGSGASRFDFTGKLKKPLDVIEGGYISWIDPVTQSIWQKFVFKGKTIFKQNGQVVTTKASPAGQGLDRLNGRSLRQYIDSITPSPLLAEIKERKSSHLSKFKAEKKQIVAARTANAEMLCAHL
jgi:hypothetical protein